MNPERTDPQLRVFVSSVVEGFKEYRDAARRGIEAAGAEAVMVNEDFPSLASSSRNACLDAVESSDAYIAIIGERGGWKAPSGKLVVEEEYEHARKNALPSLLFVKNAERDPDAEELVRKLSDYINGYFRETFDTPSELEAAVQGAIEAMPTPSSGNATYQQLEEAVARSGPQRNEPIVRFVLMPTRQEEVIDPVTLESEDFEHDVFGIAHRREVSLLDHRRSKEVEVKGSALIIRQQANQRYNTDEVSLELQESGLTVIEINLSSQLRRGGDSGLASSMVVALEDVASALRSCFAFCSLFFGEHDKFKRYQQFAYNLALLDLGNRSVVKSRPSSQQRSFQMPYRQQEGPFLAYDTPRLVNRTILEDPEDELQRAVVQIGRATRGDS